MLMLLQLGGASTARELSLLGLLVLVTTLFAVTLVFSSFSIVVRWSHKARDDERARYAARWTEPLLLAVSDEAAAASLRDSIRPDERLHFVGFAVEYARRMRGEERDALRGLVGPYLDEIVARASSERVEARARAIQTLGTLGLPDHEAEVIAALDDPSPLVAMVAARSLAQAGTPAYAGAILPRVPRFQGWNRRFLAAMLAGMGPEVSATLRDGLADERAEPKTRAVLAEALQLQGDLLAADVAATILARPTERDLLAAALRLLHEVGRPEHAAVVRPHCTASDVVVRAQALCTLGALGSVDDVPRLIANMDDASPWVALNAARGVREAGGMKLLAEIAGSESGTAVLARQVLDEAGGA